MEGNWVLRGLISSFYDCFALEGNNKRRIIIMNKGLLNTPLLNLS
jgi:hypothetical protein